MRVVASNLREPASSEYFLASVLVAQHARGDVEQHDHIVPAPIVDRARGGVDDVTHGLEELGDPFHEVVRPRDAAGQRRETKKTCHRVLYRPLGRRVANTRLGCGSGTQDQSFRSVTIPNLLNCRAGSDLGLLIPDWISPILLEPLWSHEMVGTMAVKQRAPRDAAVWPERVRDLKRVEMRERRRLKKFAAKICRNDSLVRQTHEPIVAGSDLCAACVVQAGGRSDG